MDKENEIIETGICNSQMKKYKALVDLLNDELLILYIRNGWERLCLSEFA